MWQDIVFGAGSLIFAISLIPMAYEVWHGKSITVFTSLVTGIVLLSFTLTYASLGLWYATETTLATAALWLYIGAGSYFNSR